MTDPAITGYDSFDAELLAKIDGEKLSVGYHNPFLISDPGLIWLVLKGSVDIYAVPLTDGAVTGTGQHLMRVSEGELIFGIPAIPDGAVADGRAQIGLRAVATMGTELFRARRGDIEQDDFDLIVVDWIDRWIGALAEILAPVGGPRPTGYLEAEPEIDFPAGAVLTPQRGDTIWVTLEAGYATAIGRWHMTADPAGTPLPLAGNMWLACEADCRLTGAYTPTALFRGTLWPGLDAFHLAAMQVIARQREEAGASETSRLERKAGANRATFNASLRRIGGILAGPQPDGAFADTVATGDPLFDAASLVAAASGITLAPPPDEPGTLLRPLADIARRSHIRMRRVVLFDDWYRHDNGPLLAYMAADGRPVALLPDGVDRYVMADPADGTRRPVTPALADSLSGEAHVFYRPFPARAMRVRDVFAFGLRGLHRDTTTIVLMGILAGLIALATPIATGHIFASIIPRADIGGHLVIIAGLVLAALGTAVFTVTRSFAVLRVQTRMDSSIQTAVWDRLLALPVPFFRDYSSGDLADRANGINAIREVLSGTIMQSAMTVLFSLFSLLLLFWYSWKLAFIAVAIVALMLGASLAIALAQIPLQREMIGRGGKIEGLIFQLLTGLSKLRISASEPRAFAKWAEQFGITKEITYKARKLAAVQTVITTLFPLLSSILLFASISYLLQGGSGESGFGIGDFLAFNAAFGQFSAAMLGLLGTVSILIAIVPLYERVRPILEAVPEITDGKADPGAIDGTVEFSRVVFRYSPETPPIIDGVSLTIDSGSYIAFVGASGSGKSTLVRLVLGFEQPEAGGVYIDGKDISGLDMQAARRQIGVVLQNGRIMSGSIFDNIVGSLPLTIDDAWEAARMAGFDQDVEAMPMGMHTVLSEGAGTLSGGQRQRLMIARALVHKPRILILDEATSALDNRTQEVVNASLARMNMTRIVVAHRLSTIQNVDRIFVMRQGRIVEQGDFNALMALNGEFAELARRQLV